MLVLVFLLSFPLLAGWLEKNNSWCEKIGAVVMCYGIGILLGNIGVDFSSNAFLKNTVDLSIPLAIPLFIYSTDFMGWLKNSKTTVYSFASCIFLVCLFSLLMGFIFKDSVENAWQISGMLVGVYTGGTPNLTAIGQSLGTPGETIILTNSIDMIIGSFFLGLLLIRGNLFLKNFLLPSEQVPLDHIEQSNEAPAWKRLIPSGIKAFLLSIAGLGSAFVLSQVIFKDTNVGFIIFAISSFGILFSFIPQVRKLEGSMPLGQYLLMVFCLGLGMLSDLSQITKDIGAIFIMISLVVFLSLVFHFVLSKIFKVDRDTAVITCVAAIFGPPFVPLIAQRFNNEKMIIPGITTGLVGLAIGNFLGLGVAQILKFFN